MISIIMPFYNRVDLVHQRLDDFRKYIPRDDVEIILVNDASLEEADGIVAFWQKSIGVHKIRYIKNEKNMGYGYSMNRGVSKASGDIVILINTDVVVFSDFASEISYILAGEDKVLVGPQLLDFDTGWNNFNGTIIPYLNGWILACKKKDWDELGGFDPIYQPADYEDVDLCYAAMQKGFRLETLKNCQLVHMGGQSHGFTPERAERTKINRLKFAKKWGFE